MNKKEFYLRNDKVRINLIEYINELSLDELHPIVVTFNEMKRSLDQNALMWSLLDCFSKQKQWLVNNNLGYLTAFEWKDVLTASFFNETQRLAMGINGGLIMLGSKTSKMNKSQFTEFIEFIYASGDELGIKFDEIYEPSEFDTE